MTVIDDVFAHERSPLLPQYGDRYPPPIVHIKNSNSLLTVDFGLFREGEIQKLRFLSTFGSAIEPKKILNAVTPTIALNAMKVQ